MIQVVQGSLSRCTLQWASSCIDASSYLWHRSDWSVWTSAGSGRKVWWRCDRWCVGNSGGQPFWGWQRESLKLGQFCGCNALKEENGAHPDHDISWWFVLFLSYVSVFWVTFVPCRSWRCGCRRSHSWPPRVSYNSYAKWCKVKEWQIEAEQLFTTSKCLETCKPALKMQPLESLDAWGTRVRNDRTFRDEVQNLQDSSRN